MKLPVCLALDGHDGSGKTTLATALATRLSFTYARPFAGKTGAAFLKAAESGQVVEAITIAHASVDSMLATHAGEEGIVCDRLWLTVLSVLPDDALSDWTYRPPLLLCWSDLATTLARLRMRNEHQEALTWHRRYIHRYLELGRQFGISVLRTDLSGPEECLEQAYDWAQKTLKAAVKSTRPV